MLSYFESLSQEMAALQKRVRNFIKDGHWPTDGEWKESVIRTLLRRNLPDTIAIGRGFVVCKSGVSTQVDVLLYDRSFPVLFRDGDLVFVTPDAVRGVIEVKSTINASNAREALQKLALMADLMGSGNFARIFALFAYELNGSPETILELLPATAQRSESKVISTVCLGFDHFVKFWFCDPALPRIRRPIRRWHLYKIEREAPGYFLHHVIRHTAQESVGENAHIWYPGRSMEEIERLKIKEAALISEGLQ